MAEIVVVLMVEGCYHTSWTRNLVDLDWRAVMTVTVVDFADYREYSYTQDLLPLYYRMKGEGVVPVGDNYSLRKLTSMSDRWEVERCTLPRAVRDGAAFDRGILSALGYNKALDFY